MPGVWTAKASRPPKRGPRGYDAGKHVHGRKRHIAVDTGGLLLRVIVHSAGIQDRDGGKLLVASLAEPDAFPRLPHLWADGAYGGTVAFAARYGGLTIELVTRPEGTKGFTLLPRRWVVERTFAWLGNCRRRSKACELLPETAEAFIYLAMIHLMLRRLAPA